MRGGGCLGRDPVARFESDIGKTRRLHGRTRNASLRARPSDRRAIQSCYLSSTLTPGCISPSLM